MYNVFTKKNGKGEYSMIKFSSEEYRKSFRSTGIETFNSYAGWGIICEGKMYSEVPAGASVSDGFNGKLTAPVAEGTYTLWARSVNGTHHGWRWEKEA